jgi:O-antigen ligase
VIVVLAILVLLFKGSGGAFRPRIYWLFMASIIASLVGYMISDIAVGTLPSQYVKGWGQLVLLGGACAALMILTAHDRRNLWWFMLGTGIGGITYLLVTGVPLHTWKLGYAERIAMVILTLAPILPKRVSALVLAAFGVVNILLDYRVLGAVFIVIASIVWARSTRAVRPVPTTAQLVKLALILAIGLAGVVVTTKLTESEYAARRNASNVGRAAAIIVALRAIADSPFIGYGSWTINAKLATMVQQEVEKTRDHSLVRVAPVRYGATGFAAHSQILQSWVEGGLLGAMFFFVYGYQIVRALYWYTFRRQPDVFYAAFIFTLTIGLWNWAASPFHGAQRIQIALAVSVIAAISYEEQKRRRRNLSQATTTSVALAQSEPPVTTTGRS